MTTKPNQAARCKLCEHSDGVYANGVCKWVAPPGELPCICVCVFPATESQDEGATVRVRHVIEDEGEWYSVQAQTGDEEMSVNENPELSTASPRTLRAAQGDGVAGWQPIETAPKNRKLIVGYFNPLGKWRTILATYFTEGTLESDTDDSGFAPEGWYEATEAYEYLMPVEHEPERWMFPPDSPRSTSDVFENPELEKSRRPETESSEPSSLPAAELPEYETVQRYRRIDGFDVPAQVDIYEKSRDYPCVASVHETQQNLALEIVRLLNARVHPHGDRDELLKEAAYLLNTLAPVMCLNWVVGDCGKCRACRVYRCIEALEATTRTTEGEKG